MSGVSGRRWVFVGLLSGCVWGGIAYLLGRNWLGEPVWGGVIASPAIGLLVAGAGRRFPAAGNVRRWLFALFALYLAAALFGAAVGLFDVARAVPDRNSGDVVFQGILGVLWGVTFTGYVLLLWPLAYLNGRLLRRTNE